MTIVDRSFQGVVEPLGEGVMAYSGYWTERGEKYCTQRGASLTAYNSRCAMEVAQGSSPTSPKPPGASSLELGSPLRRPQRSSKLHLQ